MDKRPAVVLCALLLSGCAVKSTAAIVAAEQVLSDAREAGAEQTALYELTLAESYLDKAREEWAGSQYQDADRLAADAQAHALEAERLAVRERNVAGAAGDVVPEDVAPTPTDEGALQPAEPADDSELLELIEDKGDGADEGTDEGTDDGRNSVLQDDKLDEDIFDEDAE